MKIIAIYVAIGLIEYLLCSIQVKILVKSEERRNQYRYKYIGTPFERWFAFVKAIFIYSIPILRTILTIAVLFVEDTQDAVMEAYANNPNIEIVDFDEEGGK